MKIRLILFACLIMVCLSACSITKHISHPIKGYTFKPDDKLLIVNIENVSAFHQDEILNLYAKSLESKGNSKLINRFDALYYLKLWFKKMPSYDNLNHQDALKIREVTGANYLIFIKVLSGSGNTPLYYQTPKDMVARNYNNKQSTKVKVGVKVYKVVDNNTIKAFSLVSRSKEIELSIPAKEDKDYYHNISTYDIGPLTIKTLKKNASKMSKLLNFSPK